MSTNAFDEIDETPIEENIRVKAKIALHEDYENSQISFVIEEVLEGSASYQGGIFLVHSGDFIEGYDTYEAELKISEYESISTPNIQCIKIVPID